MEERFVTVLIWRNHDEELSLWVDAQAPLQHLSLIAGGAVETVAYRWIDDV